RTPPVRGTGSGLLWLRDGAQERRAWKVLVVTNRPARPRRCDLAPHQLPKQVGPAADAGGDAQSPPWVAGAPDWEQEAHTPAGHPPLRPRRAAHAPTERTPSIPSARQRRTRKKPRTGRGFGYCLGVARLLRRHHAGQLQALGGIAPLVVVPGHQLDEGV